MHVFTALMTSSIKNAEMHYENGDMQENKT